MASLLGLGGFVCTFFALFLGCIPTLHIFLFFSSHSNCCASPFSRPVGLSASPCRAFIQKVLLEWKPRFTSTNAHERSPQQRSTSPKGQRCQGREALLQSSGNARSAFDQTQEIRRRCSFFFLKKMISSLCFIHFVFQVHRIHTGLNVHEAGRQKLCKRKLIDVVGAVWLVELAVCVGGINGKNTITFFLRKIPLVLKLHPNTQLH